MIMIKYFLHSIRCKYIPYISYCFSSVFLSTEIEAIEACKWLRAAGFPQYAQMYEGKFDIFLLYVILFYWTAKGTQLNRVWIWVEIFLRFIVEKVCEIEWKMPENSTPHLSTLWITFWFYLMYTCLAMDRQGTEISMKCFMCEWQTIYRFFFI